MLFIFKVVSKLTLTTQTWRKKMDMCYHHHFNHRDSKHCLAKVSDGRIRTAGFSMVPTSPWRTSCTVPSPGTCSGQQLLYYSPALSHPRGEGRMHPESKNAIWEKWTQPSNERKQLGFLALPLFCFRLWSNCFYSLYLYFTSKKLSPGWSPQLYGTEPWAPISARITHSNTNNGNRNDQ